MTRLELQTWSWHAQTKSACLKRVSVFVHWKQVNILIIKISALTPQRLAWWLKRCFRSRGGQRLLWAVERNLALRGKQTRERCGKQKRKISLGSVYKCKWSSLRIWKMLTLENIWGRFACFLQSTCIKTWPLFHEVTHCLYRHGQNCWYLPLKKEKPTTVTDKTQNITEPPPCFTAVFFALMLHFCICEHRADAFCQKAPVLSNLSKKISRDAFWQIPVLFFYYLFSTAVSSFAFFH